MIRWFADLPIERKLRVVITVPAMTAFAIAMVMHVATSLLHVREDMQRCATRIARVTGVSVIQALQAGDEAAALKALDELRDEPLVGVVEIFLPNGRKLATYRRGPTSAQLERIAHWEPAPRRIPPAHPIQAAADRSPATPVHFHVTAAAAQTASSSATCTSSRR